MTQDIAGLWQGNYAYNTPDRRPVPFVARIEQNGTTLSGSIREPNTFANDDLDELLAVLDGYIAGPVVVFAKSYLGGERADHTVQYTGLVDEKAMRIRGDWQIGSWTGVFEMSREGMDRQKERAIMETVKL